MLLSGLHEDLAQLLSHSLQLYVIAKPSSMRYVGIIGNPSARVAGCTSLFSVFQDSVSVRVS